LSRRGGLANKWGRVYIKKMRGKSCIIALLLAAGTSGALGGEDSGRRWGFEFDIYEGYNSNVGTTSSNPVASWYTQLDGSGQYKFGNSRTQVEAEIGAGLTFYYDAPNGEFFYPDLELAVQAAHSVSSRMEVSLASTTAFLSQPSYGIPGASVAQGNYWYSSTTVGMSYQWRPKISTETSWQLDAYLYADQFSQQNLGRIEQTGSQQILFLWKPQTALVGEYRINPRTYLYAPEMDSIGQFFLLGADHSFSGKMKGHFRAGLEQRWLNEPNGGQGSYLGPYGEIGLVGTLAKTKFDFTARYGTQSSGIVGVGESDTLMVNLAAERRITARISLTGFLNYQNNQFDQQNTGPNFSDNVIDSGVGASYQLNKSLSFQTGYRYSTLLSGESYREYNRSIFYIGSEFSF
jgi:hypothetical protein